MLKPSGNENTFARNAKTGPRVCWCVCALACHVRGVFAHSRQCVGEINRTGQKFGRPTRVTGKFLSPLTCSIHVTHMNRCWGGGVNYLPARRWYNSQTNWHATQACLLTIHWNPGALSTNMPTPDFLGHHALQVSVLHTSHVASLRLPRSWQCQPPGLNCTFSQCELSQMERLR